VAEGALGGPSAVARRGVTGGAGHAGGAAGQVRSVAPRAAAAELRHRRATVLRRARPGGAVERSGVDLAVEVELRGAVQLARREDRARVAGGARLRRRIVGWRRRRVAVTARAAERRIRRPGGRGRRAMARGRAGPARVDVGRRDAARARELAELEVHLLVRVRQAGGDGVALRAGDGVAKGRALQMGEVRARRRSGLDDRRVHLASRIAVADRAGVSAGGHVARDGTGNALAAGGGERGDREAAERKSGGGHRSSRAWAAATGVRGREGLHR